MPKPFPGMDPYLEGYLWPDVHHRLATEISRQLMPRLRPKYVARIAVRMVKDVRLKTVEIRDVAQNELVTSIEILSPVNKRQPGLRKYREKQERLRQAGVHLLEIDFLRRGKRLFQHPRLSKVPYLVTLIRATSTSAKLWPLQLEDTLPVVPVPLRNPDPDVPLDLGAALNVIYDEAAYDLSIDYALPAPSPSLTAEQEEWLDKQLKSVGVI